MTFDTFTHVLEVWLLVNLFGLILWVAVCTFLEDNSECDELPMQHPRTTPEVSTVRKMPFDQDATA